MNFHLISIVLLFCFGTGNSTLMEARGAICRADTLPDGRYIWELTDPEKAILYGDPQEIEIEKQWRRKQAEEMGLTNFQLTASERLYLLGQKLSVALPSSRLASGAVVVDDLLGSGKYGGQQLIKLKDATPQVGEVLGYAIHQSKIFLTGRAVTHGRFDFVIAKNGQLNLGVGHYTLSGGAKEVLAAGQLKLFNGQITRISNWSGHYQPSIEQAKVFPNLLRNLGLEVSGAKLQLYDQEGKLIESIRLP